LKNNFKFDENVFGNLIWQIIEKGLILTKRIVERNYKGELRFEFVSLNSYENDMYFISDILEYELNAEFIDVYHGLDLFFRVLKKDGIKIKVLNII